MTAFHRDVFADLLPFPDLRMGWGLDAHWAAVARDRAWPVGIVDATPIQHGLRRTATGYRARRRRRRGARVPRRPPAPQRA